MYKPTISCKLHEIVDYHLFQSGTWPANRASLSVFWKVVGDMGLYEVVPGQENTHRCTLKGFDCDIDMVAVFIGAMEPLEAPSILEDRGYLDSDQADAIYSITDEKRIIRVIERHVREAYFKYCGRSHFLN